MSDSQEEHVSYPKPKYAWGIVGFLTLAYILSFLDRYILGLLLDPIKADLQFDDYQMGLLLGPAFIILYIGMALPIGLIVDRKKRTWIVAAGIAVWSGFTMLTGLARTFWLFFSARMFVGVGEAVLSPSAFSIIGDSFPKERRGKPIAFYSLALIIGSAMANFIGGYVVKWAKTAGVIDLPLVGVIEPWQLVFLSVGAPGFLLALVFFFIREPKRVESSPRDGAKLSDAFSFVGSRFFVFLTFVSVFCTMTSIAYSQGFLPSMFNRSFGWDTTKYAYINGLSIITIGPLTYFVAGWLSDEWIKKGRADAPFIISVAGLCLMVPTAIIAPLMPEGWMAFTVFCFTTVGIGMASSTGVAALLNIVPGQVRGATVALYYMCISWTGGFVAPPLVGWMSKNIYGEEHLNLAMATLPALFGIPALILLPWTLKFYRQELMKSET
ncbi:MAG: MFS transporter [Alphaproteobacteria bacterium]